MLPTDDGTSLAGNAVRRTVELGDERHASGTGLGELQRRLDLGQHRAGGKLASFNIALGSFGHELVKLGLVGLAKVDGDLLYGREDDKRVGIKLLGKAGCGKVLVDDGSGALQVVALGVVDGDAAATAGNDHVVGFDQRADGVKLDDGRGVRVVREPMETWQNNCC